MPGAWGRIAVRPAEKLRRALDLEHWAAFQRSFATMVELLADLSRGPGAPSTITLIGGDVHTASIAEVQRRRRAAEPHLAGRLLAVPQPALDEGATGRPRHAQPPARGHRRRRSPASRASSVPRAAGSSSPGRPSTTRSPCSTSTSATRRSRSGAAARRTTRARCSRSSTSASFPRRSSRISHERGPRRCGSEPSPRAHRSSDTRATQTGRRELRLRGSRRSWSQARWCRRAFPRPLALHRPSR